LNRLLNKFPVPSEFIGKSENEFKKENQEQPDNVTKVKTILAYSAEATTEEKRTQAIINNIVKPLYGIASSTLDAPCLAKVTDSQFQAITWSANVSTKL
jgi:hypothetical protein